MAFIQPSFSKELAHCSDEDLLQLYYHTSDNRFFTELFSRYVLLTYSNCYKYLQDSEKSKDSVMHIFCKILDKCQSKLLQLDNFKNWLYTIIRNECFIQKKLASKNQIELEQFLRYHFDEQDFCLNKSSVKKSKPSWEEVGTALSCLPMQQMQCLHFFYFEKKSYRKIAEISGMTVKQVKSHLQNGRRRMRSILLKQIEDE